ncbi:hypothetical protein PM082_002144 [Marasmius tenuissimus]|nr:hypothetical protein PM082_002144 [Marasmius tenuissimus]
MTRLIVEAVTREYGERSIRGQGDITREIQEVKDMMRVMQQSLAKLSKSTTKKIKSPSSRKTCTSYR